MIDQETIDRLTRELSDKHETLMTSLEALNGEQALTAFLMGRLEEVAIACGIGEGDAEAHVQGVVKRWQEEHGYGNTAVEWTRVRPTEPGRYWCLHHKTSMFFQMITISSRGHCWVNGRTVDDDLSDVLWWPIPIEPPPVPRDRKDGDAV